MLVAIGVVGRQANIQRVAGLEQQLTARGLELAIDVFVLGARARATHDIEKAVALARGDIQTTGHAFGERTGHRCRAFHRAVVAGGELDVGAEVERRPLGDDVDHAGRGVLTEQRALRTFQHLDALQLAEVAEAHAVARSINAVDDHTHRRFQAGVVAHRADASDTSGGDRLVRGRRHQQAGREDGEIFDVLDAGVLQQLLGHRGHHDRHVLQALFSLLRSDDDRIDGACFLRLRGLLAKRRHCYQSQRTHYCSAQLLTSIFHGSPLFRSNQIQNFVMAGLTSPLLLPSTRRLLSSGASERDFA